MVTILEGLPGIKPGTFQYEYDYVFDSTKFTNAFGFQPASYPEGVRRTAEAYRPASSAQPGTFLG